MVNLLRENSIGAILG